MDCLKEAEEVFSAFTLENLYLHQQAICNVIKRKEALQEIHELDRRNMIHKIVTNETAKNKL